MAPRIKRTTFQISPPCTLTRFLTVLKHARFGRLRTAAYAMSDAKSGGLCDLTHIRMSAGVNLSDFTRYSHMLWTLITFVSSRVGCFPPARMRKAICPRNWWSP